MVHLEPVTKENLDAVLRLEVSDSQKSFVSTPAESLAQAYVYTGTAFPFRDVFPFFLLRLFPAAGRISGLSYRLSVS